MFLNSTCLKTYFVTYGLWENFQDFTSRNGFNSLFSILYGNYIDIMEHLLQELEKTVQDFNNNNQ